jgi:signal peptidase II
MMWIAAVIVFVLDQLSKRAILGSLQPGESRVVIPHLLTWTYVENVHGAYGLFGDRPALLILLAAVVLVGMWWVMHERLARSPFTRIVFGAIVGGAAGNIVDRLHYGYVVDFVSVQPMPFFEVFNLADACIVLGVVALVLAGLFERERSSTLRT